MPKINLKLPPVIGFDDYTNPRKLREGIVVKAQDVILDALGTFTAMYTEATHDADTDCPGVAGPVIAGNGLFAFSTDKDTGGNEDRSNWLALYSNLEDAVYLWNDTDGWIGAPTAQIDLGAVGGGAIPVYTYVDGTLRVGNGNFTAGIIGRKWSHIERTHFNGIAPGGSADSYDAWYVRGFNIDAPTQGIQGLGVLSVDDGGGSQTTIHNTGLFVGFQAALDLGTYVAANVTSGEEKAITSSTDDIITTGAVAVSWANDAYIISPDSYAGFNMGIVAYASPTSTIPAGDYEFASSFIYDGNQESLLWDMVGSDLTIASGVGVAVNIITKSPHYAYITGGRIYMRIADSDDEWLMLVDISLRDGIRSSLTAEYTSWELAYSAPSNSDIVKATLVIPDISGDTYSTINGFSPDVEQVSISATGMGYKCAVVGANRRMYIANVNMKDKDGVTSIHGDLMLKSLPNRFDTFLYEERVEVVINDGDDVLALAFFNDRILQFKRNNLYIIDVSREYEILEGTHAHMGVYGQHQVVTLDSGVAWINDYGLFFYDGENVRNLLYEKGQKILKWETYTPTNLNDMSIGYIPGKEYLVIATNIGAAGASNLLLYHMPTGGFVLGVGVISNSTYETVSNFVNGVDGKLIYAIYNSNTPDAEIKYISTATTARGGKPIIEWGGMNFGSEGKKTAYDVGITHKGKGALPVPTPPVITLSYKIDDDTSWTSLGTLTDYANLTEEVKSKTGHIKNFRYIYLKLETTTTDVDSDFEMESPRIQIRGTKK